MAYVNSWNKSAYVELVEVSRCSCISVEHARKMALLFVIIIVISISTAMSLPPVIRIE
ncbi:uncharacterized protein LOC143907627 [Temnothorax americanus]|uniref:uncharacterized protein LOC143907627 n=1 Tax=Temnothorax americanus TaxID=1964332 RepID=UPI0040684122